LLRPFAFEQDAPALREMLQDPEVIRLTGSCHDPGEMPGWDTAAESRFRGLGTEAIRLFIYYGFEQVCLDRISLDVLNFNPRVERVYEKLGFVTEGVLRE
jgi:hypothetical protein